MIGFKPRHEVARELFHRLKDEIMPGAPHIHPGKDMGCARFINKLLQSRQCTIGIAYDGMLATDPLKGQSLPR